MSALSRLGWSHVVRYGDQPTVLRQKDAATLRTICEIMAAEWGDQTPNCGHADTGPGDCGGETD